MKKLGITTSLFFLIIISCHAQKFNTAVGLRMGTEWGATIQQRIGDKNSAEIILQQGFNQEVALLTGLYERHFRLGMRRLNLYAGIGPHYGWYVKEELNQIYENPYGISLITGLELSLARLTLSWDIKPAINFSNADHTAYFHSGLSIRYIIIKRKSRTKVFFEDDKWKFWKKEDSNKKRKK